MLVELYVGGLIAAGVMELTTDYRNKRSLKVFLSELFLRKKLDIKVQDISVNQYGFRANLHLNFKYSIEDIEPYTPYLKDSLKVYLIELESEDTEIYLNVYMSKLEDKEHKRIELSPYELLLGFNYKGNIIADMRETPHILLCGLSGQGKTQMAKTIINNLNGADIILINAFKHDFKVHKGLFINGNENIIDFLEEILESEEVHKKPMYLVLDELLVLSKDKKISKCIMDLLAIARHKNMYLIGISQIGTKEQLKFKDLFNARVCFRAIEESTYRTVLGCSVDGALKKREFYLYSNDLYKGRTFTNSN
ncbi:MAG: hypothetical protein ACRDDY_16115 [Clostridium sp.]|uniref:hypothetical protein n=1 Tax=Clostridium sp. TaxID=1506 RepID=UPI003EE49192